jgi:hypothetical protein
MNWRNVYPNRAVALEKVENIEVSGGFSSSIWVLVAEMRRRPAGVSPSHAPGSENAQYQSTYCSTFRSEHEHSLNLEIVTE